MAYNVTKSPLKNFLKEAYNIVRKVPIILFICYFERRKDVVVSRKLKSSTLA